MSTRAKPLHDEALMTGSAASETSQYLTFRLDGELFALETQRIRELLAFRGAARVPSMPDFMRGVIDLRGHVVPVVDLRLTLGLPAIENTIDSCVIIIEVEVDGERTMLGALADSVEEVIDLAGAQIKPPPRNLTRIDADCLRGIGRRDDDLVLILDINWMLGAQVLSWCK
jgi:purine-binding chemotaxis protein CheW